MKRESDSLLGHEAIQKIVRRLKALTVSEYGALINGECVWVRDLRCIARLRRGDNPLHSGDGNNPLRKKQILEASTLVAGDKSILCRYGSERCCMRKQWGRLKRRAKTKKANHNGHNGESKHVPYTSEILHWHRNATLALRKTVRWWSGRHNTSFESDCQPATLKIGHRMYEMAISVAS